MKIVVRNEQRAYRASSRALASLARWLTERASLQKDRAWSSITVTLLDDAAMTAKNREVFEKDHTTDVITMTYAPIPGDPRWQGEVFVNAECAVREGKRRKGTAPELALYIAHGIDHLTGADDTKRSDRDRMRRREMKWLREAKAEGKI